jgi:hypothetical protein
MTAAPLRSGIISIMVEEVNSPVAAVIGDGMDDGGSGSCPSATSASSSAFTWPATAAAHKTPELTLTAAEGCGDSSILSDGGGEPRARQLYHYWLRRHPAAAGGGCPTCSRRASDGDSRRLARGERCCQCGQRLAAEGYIS